MHNTTLTELIVLLSGAIVIAVASYIYGLSAGIEKERKKHE